MSLPPHEPPPFSLEQRRAQDGSRVVTVRGEIDLATAPEVQQALGARQDGEIALVLDLLGTSFLDSSGIRVLVEAHRHGAAQGVPFRVAGSRPVRELLETTGVAAHLELVDAPPA
ncbi:anti-sigma factor antagonist [Conexibacter sp. W3-3-2]|uniref:STAS domain-containing protein n=1 Tax=Conexibacter sp. W3-3-2 TaxID=2675227 RepID=UPI0012B992D2|nr:STAS domain-containing protein [Conexibacter sp. W3-3-2]MTD44383.1 anti-sigma factor antagonist [Conexibacter sp. W3-3-2]